MLTVHHLNNSRSQRILWLVEELGIPYEVKLYERDKETLLAPPALKRVHPLGKSPVVTDGENVFAESGAIIEAVLDKYGDGRLRPARGTADFLKYNFFMHYAEGSAMPPLLMSLIFSKISQSPTPLLIRPIGKAIAMAVWQKFLGPQLKTHFDFLESELSAREWFAGDAFTAADIQMSFPIEAANIRLGLDGRPKLKAFLARIHARSAYARALAAGGPLNMAF